MQDIFCWFITKKLYDSVLQNALIKLLADHYTVDYNAELDFFSKSFIQVPVSIKNPNLRPKIVKESRNLKYLKKHTK